MSTVSIVVPVYNVEAYLRRCLDSLVDQTYEDIEIWVVNDGSPDNSQEIIDEYAEKYPKVHSLIKENGGLSDARNFGLQYVDSPYVMFTDSDDYVEKDMVERCMKKIEEDGSDIVVFDYFQDYVALGRTEIIACRIEEGAYELEEEHSLLAYTPNAAWNKLYRTSLFKDNDILYPKGIIYEDLATTFKLLQLADKISYLNVPLYHYQVGRPGQIMSRVRPDIVTACRIMTEWYQERGIFEKYYDELCYIATVNLNETLRSACTLDDKKEAFRMIDLIFDFKEKYYSRACLKYDVVTKKSDNVYQNRKLCKIYYGLKHVRA